MICELTERSAIAGDPAARTDRAAGLSETSHVVDRASVRWVNTRERWELRIDFVGGWGVAFPSAKEARPPAKGSTVTVTRRLANGSLVWVDADAMRLYTAPPESRFRRDAAVVYAPWVHRSRHVIDASAIDDVDGVPTLILELTDGGYLEFPASTSVAPDSGQELVVIRRLLDRAVLEVAIDGTVAYQRVNEQDGRDYVIVSSLLVRDITESSGLLTLTGVDGATVHVPRPSQDAMAFVSAGAYVTVHRECSGTLAHVVVLHIDDATSIGDYELFCGSLPRHEARRLVVGAANQAAIPSAWLAWDQNGTPGVSFA